MENIKHTPDCDNCDKLDTIVVDEGVMEEYFICKSGGKPWDECPKDKPDKRLVWSG